MPLPLLGLIQVVIDLAVMAAMIFALVSIAGIIKDFLVENLVDILVEMPRFDYSFQDGRESGGVLFNLYKWQRDLVVWPLILIGSLAWLITGRFGHRMKAAIHSERVKPITQGVHQLMRPPSAQMERDEKTPHVEMDFGTDSKPGGGWFGQWLAGLPSKCALFIVLIFILPPLWDAAMDGSGWAAGVILNPVYSGNPDYPCPAGWYDNGRLDLSNPDLQDHHESVLWLLMQDRTGELDAMCRPELRVRYMLEQWGGQTKAIPPPVDTTDSFWGMITSMGENATDWMMRGIGEFFINIILGVIKAQAVIMSGTAMIISNLVVDIGVATMIIFTPVYFALLLVPWERIGGGRVLAAIRTYGPASLAAAILYPIEVAVLFAVSSNLMVYLLLSEYGNDLLVVWLFGTAIMSMVVAIPIVSLGAFAHVTETVTGKFTALIQTAQGGIGSAAGGLGMRGPGMGGAGVAGGAGIGAGGTKGIGGAFGGPGSSTKGAFKK